MLFQLYELSVINKISEQDWKHQLKVKTKPWYFCEMLCIMLRTKLCS